jgi:Core-2/I-Branching enzyme
MTVAYCVLAHKSPVQTQRLVARLLSDDLDGLVFLHYGGAATLDLPHLASRVRTLPTRPICWGCPEISDIFVEMFRAALREGCSYGVMLSGQDYPLRNLASLRDELGSYDVWADLRPLFNDDGTCNWDEGRRRYAYKWWHIKNATRAHKAVDRLVAKAFGAKVSRRELPLPYLVRYRQRGQLWWGHRHDGPGLPIYTGSMWMSLSAPAMDAICSAPPRVRSFFHHVPIADEAYFQSVLGNSPALTFSPNNGRFIRWIDENESPVILTSADLREALASGAQFGRKFDELVDPRVLRELDELSNQTTSA